MILTIWLCILTVLSLAPIGGGPKFFPHQDKVAHFIFYAITCSLIIFEFRRRRPAVAGDRGRYIKTLMLAAALSSVFGLLMEVGQEVFTTTRHFEVMDNVANMSGSIAAALYLMRRTPAIGGRDGTD